MTRRWVSPEKSLPKWGELVIVAHVAYEWSNKTHRYRRKRKLNVTTAVYEGDGRFAQREHYIDEVAAWMPLPEPPEVT